MSHKKNNYFVFMLGKAVIPMKPMMKYLSFDHLTYFVYNEDNDLALIKNTTLQYLCAVRVLESKINYTEGLCDELRQYVEEVKVGTIGYHRVDFKLWMDALNGYTSIEFPLRLRELRDLNYHMEIVDSVTLRCPGYVCIGGDEVNDFLLQLSDKIACGDALVGQSFGSPSIIVYFETETACNELTYIKFCGAGSKIETGYIYLSPPDVALSVKEKIEIFSKIILQGHNSISWRSTITW